MSGAPAIGRVVVAGGAGAVGSLFAEQLQDSGNDVVIVDGQPHPAILGHEDMGEEWAPELLDAALTGAGWVRTGNWDTASRSATVTRA